ncbi:MAG: hypothetical protein PF961_09390 [Planctomycetota bacterium]|nr:hypothetical protein [Planctomycetota bacterium]
MEHACQISDLRKSYPSGNDRIEVLRGVDLFADPGLAAGRVPPAGI